MTAGGMAGSYSSDMTSRPAARCARVVHLSLAPLRAWGMPGTRCTRSLVCIGRKHTSIHHRYPGTPGIPCAMVLTAYVVLSPVTGLFCHRHQRIKVLSAPGRADLPSANLTPASGSQDHTTSPSAATSFVSSPFDRSQVFRPALHHVARLTLPRPPHPTPRS